MRRLKKILLAQICKECSVALTKELVWDPKGGPIKKGKWNIIFTCPKCKKQIIE